MEKWGADLYGDPCRQCGFDWQLDPAAAIELMEAIPERYAKVLAGASGQERHPGVTWTTAAYVCHVTDNLRIWAERLAGAYTTGDLIVPGYDADLLAEARQYNRLSLGGALWSLGLAVEIWVEAVENALLADVELHHATRGSQPAEDVVLNNLHDAMHHLQDIADSLRYAADQLRQ